MKNPNKILTVAQRCKNILACNFRGQLHTIKADAKGSKDEIHSSQIKCFFKKIKPYIWVPGDDLHNVNTIIDERGALSVANALPGPLTSLLKSLKKLPARVAVSGGIVHLKDEKLIDGINQNRARRRALMLFCFALLNINARDAFMLSVDCKGFDILGKVPGEMTKDGFRQYEWKEFRFDLQEAASDIESFCRLLVDLEEGAL